MVSTLHSLGRGEKLRDTFANSFSRMKPSALLGCHPSRSAGAKVAIAAAVSRKDKWSWPEA
jgi:hypothetical protein